MLLLVALTIGAIDGGHFVAHTLHYVPNAFDEVTLSCNTVFHSFYFVNPSIDFIVVVYYLIGSSPPFIAVLVYIVGVRDGVAVGLRQNKSNR